jgi:phosphatidylserine/phosphatidylglycerophosphate/cardiolipin synthase-like enzyme/DNA uptake protein ComE-like DNA-binding protein
MRNDRNLYGAIFALGLTACQSATPQVVRPTPLPQEADVQVFMNHEPAAQYTEPYRPQTRTGEDLEQIMVDTIATAQTTIAVAVQELRLPKVAQALRDRQAAGVKIRVILENTYARPYSRFKPADLAKLPEREKARYQEAVSLLDRNHDQQLSPEEIANGDALVMLDNAKIPRIDDTADGSAGSNLMHHKFIVIDQQTVVVSSANLTTSDVHGDFASVASRGNANNLVKINSAELAALFLEEFDLMWGDGPGGQPDSRFGTKKPARPVREVKVGGATIAVHFSPNAKSTSWADSSNGLIAKVLGTAEHSINLALFVFSDQQLVNQLEPKHTQSVDIRALIEPGFMYRNYSEGLDMLGVELRPDCHAEANNRPWQNPITTVGVPRMPPGDMLHHKFGLIDGKTVITGSHNWTEAANQGNDETLLVIQSPVVAAHYQREFERLYADAILGVPPAIEKKAAAAKQCPPSAKPQGEEAIDDPELSATTSTPGNSQHRRKAAEPAVNPQANSDLTVTAAPSASPPTPSSPPSDTETAAPEKPRTKRHSRKPKKKPAQLEAVSPETDSSSAASPPPTTPQTASPQTASPAAASAPGQPVNLNTASAAAIDALPGVSPGLAKRIVAARQQQPFASLADLDRVPGVGPKLLKKLQDKVTW